MRVGESTSTHPTHEFDSGQPAGTTIYEDEVVSAESTEKRSRLWFDGRDSALFDVVTGDLVPGAYVSTITQTVVSARPIPAGEYKVNNNYLLLPFIPCNHVFTYGMTMTVTAPEGTVHEAFFDPVVIGAAVGADGSRGVLKPASFAIEGVGTTDIKRIRWESARVEMQIDPPGRPTGHHIDFIALDGTVVLRLDFDDAVDVVEEGRTRALTWGVCERSWNDGDLLMLRISESPPGLTGTTNDVLCPPPPPQNLTASSTQDSVTLTWDVADDPTVMGYLILRRIARQDTFSKFEVTNGTATTYVDTTDIEPGTKYIYRVHAVNAVGLSEVSRVTATPAATPSIPVTDVAGTSPPSPQGLTASSTHESVTLMWDAGDDPPTGYLILRRVAKQDTFVKFEVTNGTATTYVDTTDIEPGTKYIYRVHAVNAVGLSEVSRVTATPAATPSIPVTDVAGTSPPSPQGLTASSTHESVTLMWDAGDDPPTGYLILRRVAKQDTFVKFEVTNGTATTYVDTTDIEPGTKYIYRVHAVNAAGLSEVSRVTVHDTHSAVTEQDLCESRTTPMLSP